MENPLKVAKRKMDKMSNFNIKQDAAMKARERAEALRQRRANDEIADAFEE